MWVQKNLNPCGRVVGDCTVRAIAIATGEDWETAYFGLALQGLIMADMPSANAVTTAYLRKKGFKRHTIPDSYQEDYTVKDFCVDHPTGTYVLGIGTHIVAVIDGNYIDSWDSGNETPVYYFEREDNQ